MKDSAAIAWRFERSRNGNRFVHYHHLGYSGKHRIHLVAYPDRIKRSDYIRFQIIIKSKQSERPLIITPGVGFDRYFFRPGFFLLHLVQPEYGFGRIIGVHVHIVGQVLETGISIEQDLFAGILQVDAAVDKRATVLSRMILVGRCDFSVRIVPVWESSLPAGIGTESELNFPLRMDQPIDPQASTRIRQVIGFFT